MLKDVRLALAEAETAGAPMPSVSVVHDTEVERILRSTITGPVGPAFMAPPTRVVDHRSEVLTSSQTWPKDFARRSPRLRPFASMKRRR